MREYHRSYETNVAYHEAKEDSLVENPFRDATGTDILGDVRTPNDSQLAAIDNLEIDERLLTNNEETYDGQVLDENTDIPPDHREEVRQFHRAA